MKPNLSLLAPALLALAGALALAPARADTADASDRRVAIGSGAVVGAAETQPQDVVSVLGSTTVDGEAGHNAVAVLGGATVTGTVDHDVVVVLGNLYVNGTVGHNAVAVLGNIHLGPKALIEGDVVSVNGSVHKDPGARIGGSIVHSGIGSIAGAPDAAYRPVGWLRAPVFRHLWPLQLLGLVLSALVALVFPGAVRTTGDQLRERPGLVVLSAILAPPALPILTLLLLITLVGLVFIPFLLAAVIGVALFGELSLYALIGRSLTRDRVHPAVGVVIGAVLFQILYTAPFGGFALHVCVLLLGFGCAFTALFPSVGRPAPVAPPAPGPVPPPPGPAAPEPSVPPAPPAPAEPVPEPPAAPLAAPAPSAAPPPAIPAALPRAGFWIRMGGLLIDALILVVFAHFWVLAIAIYGAVMWKLKGATVGGIVFGLKVVRLDGRPVEWDTAIVRALGCYLSAVALFLGFVWIAFDGEKQAWHDKIAGTVVVRARDLSLV